MDRILLAAFLILSLCSCESNDGIPIQEPVQPAWVSGMESIKQGKPAQASAHQPLVVAAFYEKPAATNSVIKYDNAADTSAVKITYSENGTSKTERLVPEQKNIFRVSGKEERYRINAKNVEHYGVYDKKAFSYLYDRTDL